MPSKINFEEKKIFSSINDVKKFIRTLPSSSFSLGKTKLPSTLLECANKST